MNHGALYLYVVICDYMCMSKHNKKDLNLSISVVPTIKLSAKDRQQQGLIPRRRGWAKFLRLDARAADVVYIYICLYVYSFFLKHILSENHVVVFK